MLDRSVAPPSPWPRRLAREWLWLCASTGLGLLYWRYGSGAVTTWDAGIVLFAALIWGPVAYVATGAIRLTIWAIHTLIRR